MQFHVPLAEITDPTIAKWKVQNVIKTLDPGKSFVFSRNPTGNARVSPKAVRSFPSQVKILGADLLEFRVMIGDMTVANEEPLAPTDAILRIESGHAKDIRKGGIHYRTIDFVPKDSTIIKHESNQIVSLVELDAGAFDSLTPENLDHTDPPAPGSRRVGYVTTFIHPMEDEHDLRGVQVVDMPNDQGKALMLVTQHSIVGQPRPLKIGYEHDLSAVLTDPALDISIVRHVDDAGWWSGYVSMKVFKYESNIGAWLLWDEDKNQHYNILSLGAFLHSNNSFCTVETPLCVTTFSAMELEDFPARIRKGLVAKAVRETGHNLLCAEKWADTMLEGKIRRDFPNSQRNRTMTIDWGEIFTTVLLGALLI